MARNASIVLNDHLADFIDEQLGKGSYESASDVVRAGLELLEEREAKTQALIDALVEGEQSGPTIEFDTDAFLARMHVKHGVKP